MPINRGAVGAIAEYAEEKRKRREEAYKSDREFQQRLYEAGLKGEIEAGRIGLNLKTGRLEFRTPVSFDRSALGPGERATFPLPGGGTRTYVGPSRTSDTPLTGTAEQALIGLEEPGVPFSGAVPVSRPALNTLQRGIAGNRFESPASVALGLRPYLPNAQGAYTLPTPVVPPAREAFRSQLGTIARVVSAASLPGLSIPRRPPRPAVSPRRVPTAASRSSLTMWIADAQAASAEGFAREDIEEQLRQFSLPEDEIQQILDAAGL